jgi:peptidoglycan/LPS O-acetylase OafA/YrhL
MPAQRAKGQIAALTGLRGLAVLLVIVAHFSEWLNVTPAAAVPAWIGPWLRTSSIGMAIFFTLSGYVIALTYSGWDWRDRPGFNLVRLFFYRFARLYPAFFVFTLLIILRTPVLHDFSNPDVWAYVGSHLLLWQSWWPAKYDGVLVGDDAFHVSWSLSTECALYLLFGLGAIVASWLAPWRLKPLIVGAAFFATVIVLLQVAQPMTPTGWTDGEWDRWLSYYSPLGVSIQFGIGVLASRIKLSGRAAAAASNLGAAWLTVVYLLVVCGIMWRSREVSLLGDTLLAPSAAIGTALLMMGALSSSPVNVLLTRPSLLYVGTISYSLYLFHFAMPAIAFHGEFDRFGLPAAIFYVLNFAVTFALTIMLATGLYQLVEVPGRRLIRAAADQLLGIRSTRQAAAAE